jgi:pimeloyl-ACP methyl ester carboxylesterase
MSYFSFKTFSILAHDRGARVAHRLALDHGQKVEKMVLLDIAPTLWMYQHTDMAFVSCFVSLFIFKNVILDSLSRLRDIGIGFSLFNLVHKLRK